MVRDNNYLFIPRLGVTYVEYVGSDYFMSALFEYLLPVQLTNTRLLLFVHSTQLCPTLGHMCFGFHALFCSIAVKIRHCALHIVFQCKEWL